MYTTRQFLNAYPDITMVEALITDCNGIARGKWLPVQKLSTIEKQGLKLPKSALGLDVWGRDIPELAHANGDIDGYCHLVEGSLRPLLTERGVDQAQVILTMSDKDGSAFMGDPRQVLNALVGRFTEKSLKPCMAVELEFSLLPRPETNDSVGSALRDQNSLGGNLYALSELDYHAPLLEALRVAFETQDLPYEGIIKESAPSQFEINVAHSDDVMLLADQVIRMQRTIRAVAARHGFTASFMPKPIDDEAGNGLHVHCSLLEENGINVFDNGEESGSDLLHMQSPAAWNYSLRRCCYSRPVSTPTVAFSRATTHRQKQLGAMTTGRPRSEFQRALRQHAGLNTVWRVQMPTRISFLRPYSQASGMASKTSLPHRQLLRGMHGI